MNKILNIAIESLCILVYVRLLMYYEYNKLVLFFYLLLNKSICSGLYVFLNYPFTIDKGDNTCVLQNWYLFA
jgi:hypothetical protein